MSEQPLFVQEHLIIDASRSLSAELLWTSDQPVAETSPDNTQHTHQTSTNAPGGIWVWNPSKRAATDLRLTPHGLCDRQWLITSNFNLLIAKYKAIFLEQQRSYCYDLVVASAVFAAFKVALVQKQGPLHSLPNGPGATKGRYAQPSKWPRSNKRPLYTAFQVDLLQQKAAQHCCTWTRRSFRTAALRNLTFSLKLWPALTAVFRAGTFGRRSN